MYNKTTLLVVGVVIGFSGAFAVAQEIMTHSDYNRARHIAANRAITDLADSVARTDDAPRPFVGRNGDGAVPRFSPVPGTVALVGTTDRSFEGLALGDERTGVAEDVLVDAHTGDVRLAVDQARGALNRTIYDSQGLEQTSTVVLRSEGGAASASAEVNRNYDGFG